jgi:hypothetical protein
MGTVPDLDAMVVTARLIGFEHRQVAGLDQTGILLHGSLDGPVDGNAVVVEFFQGTTADASYHDSIHLLPTEGGHGIAGTMLMILVWVFESFNGVRIQVHKDKEGCGTEMVVDIAVNTVVF